MSLASVKSRLVLPFRYQLTRVVPDKGPLNVHACVCVLVSGSWYKGSRSLVDEEDRMRPGHWLGSVLCVRCTASTLTAG